MGMHKNQLDHYLSLNYRIEIERDEEGDYVANIPLLPGCLADGATVEDAATRVQDAKAEWIAARLEADLPIPEPQNEFSGRWVVRTTPSLHRKISDCARREEVSINQFVNNVLSEAVGCRQLFANLSTQNCSVFVGQHPHGGFRMLLAFGNALSGGLLWQNRMMTGGQSDPATKPVSLPEVAEMRA